MRIDGARREMNGGKRLCGRAVEKMTFEVVEGAGHEGNGILDLELWLTG